MGTLEPSKPFLIFFTLSALFILSMFYRVSNAVIAPNLIQDLGLNAETLGILGGAFFYSFALLQIPMGPMLDRIGPRIIITFFSLIGALGAFLFGLGNSFILVLIGRVLIGAGMSCILMGSMKVFLLRFPSDKFATLNGLLISVGTLGNVLAASPLALLTAIIGWRTTFILAGWTTTLLAFLAFWVLGSEKKKEKPSYSSFSSNSMIGIFQSMRLILGTLVFWQMAAIAFFRYGTFVGLQGLWLGPYLINIKGYSPVVTGNFLLLMAIGVIIGGPIAGRLSDRIFYSQRKVALWGLGLYALSLFPLNEVIEIQNPFWYGLTLFFIGFFTSFGMLIYAHAKDLFPLAISGTVMTLVNFFTMSGGGIFMPALGKVIESFPMTDHTYPPEAYHLAFLICFLGMASSVIFYAYSRKESRGDTET